MNIYLMHFIYVGNRSVSSCAIRSEVCTYQHLSSKNFVCSSYMGSHYNSSTK